MEQIDDSTTWESTSTEIEETIDKKNKNLLPEKSKLRYEQTYQHFKEWHERKNFKNLSESVLLAYFVEKAETQKPSTLWAHYSMLKSVFLLKKNLDISKYRKLSTLLKRKSKGYRPKMSKILTREQIQTFLKEADDKDFLMMKVAVIFGIAGACRRTELTYMSVDQIEEKSDLLVVKVPDSATKTERTFIVTEGNMEGINFLDIYRRYASLRPSHVNHNRFFVNYRKGKCSIQAVGMNTFGKLPKMVAEYLRLPNSAEYTGHCFRRSSASLLANVGAGLTYL